VAGASNRETKKIGQCAELSNSLSARPEAGENLVGGSRRRVLIPRSTREPEPECLFGTSTLRYTVLRMSLLAILPKKPSTRLSQFTRVGVKCRYNQGLRSRHRFIAGPLFCVAVQGETVGASQHDPLRRQHLRCRSTTSQRRQGRPLNVDQFQSGQFRTTTITHTRTNRT